MPEIPNPYLTEPDRKESAGEKRARHVNNVKQIADDLHVNLSQSEQSQIADFIVKISSQITDAEKEALASMIANAFKWFIGKRST